MAFEELDFEEQRLLALIVRARKVARARYAILLAVAASLAVALALVGNALDWSNSLTSILGTVLVAVLCLFGLPWALLAGADLGGKAERPVEPGPTAAA